MNLGAIFLWRVRTCIRGDGGNAAGYGGENVLWDLTNSTAWFFNLLDTELLYQVLVNWGLSQGKGGLPLLIFLQGLGMRWGAGCRKYTSILTHICAHKHTGECAERWAFRVLCGYDISLGEQNSDRGPQESRLLCTDSHWGRGGADTSCVLDI